MKLLVCCGLSALIAGVLVCMTGSNAAANQQVGGCYSEIQGGVPVLPAHKGSAEAPQRCHMHGPCQAHSCERCEDGKYRKTSATVMVGMCEPTSCPDTARCVVCEHAFYCALCQVWTNEFDCKNNLLGYTIGFAYSIDGSYCTDTANG